MNDGETSNTSSIERDIAADLIYNDENETDAEDHAFDDNKEDDDAGYKSNTDEGDEADNEEKANEQVDKDETDDNDQENH